MADTIDQIRQVYAARRQEAAPPRYTFVNGSVRWENLTREELNDHVLAVVHHNASAEFSWREGHTTLEVQ